MTSRLTHVTRLLVQSHREPSRPGAVVYALRLDRGLSPPEIFDTVPGTHWDRERGWTTSSTSCRAAAASGRS